MACPPEPGARILLIEDESQIRRFLRISLEAHQFSVCEARLGKEGLALCAAETPDLVILDLGLPDMDGQEVLKRLREWTAVPVIVLSVRADEAGKVAALDAGADDYVAKPFGISELMARIRVALRPQKPVKAASALIEFGDIVVNLAARQVLRNGCEIGLSQKEYELLRLLLNHRGQVLTHKQILTAIWGAAHEEDTHYLRVLVGHLRRKLGEDPARPQRILTVQGVGYRFASAP